MPVEFIPEDQRDPDQVIRDALLEVEQAKAVYDAAILNWTNLMQQYGHPITEPAPRWN